MPKAPDGGWLLDDRPPVYRKDGSVFDPAAGEPEPEPEPEPKNDDDVKGG